MRLRRSVLLFLLLAGCQTARAESSVAPSGDPPAATVATTIVESDPGRWAMAEMRGAPYARATAASLAALVPREPSGAQADERARRAFEALSTAEQEDLLEWFTVECEKLGTFQETLLRFVLDGAEREASTWPDLAPPTWYDPAVHATGQPIPRAPLAASSPEVVAVRNQILCAPGARRLDSGWMVDYAARGLVRLPHQGDPRRVFENGLLGMAPDWDLAEALVELALDDGSLQKSFQAFAHAYTDRWGGVYPGVTLYDAHASHTQIEMPDVDCLGLAHDLLGDWTTWTSPVPAEQHEEFYAKIEELFRAVAHHRALRTNLARTYLCGNAELRDNYLYNLDNFHALWESVASDPLAMRVRLPDDGGWKDFLQGWHDSVAADTELAYRGASRHATLDRGAQMVRAKLLRLLGEYGAFARIETLPPFDE